MEEEKIETWKERRREKTARDPFFKRVTVKRIIKNPLAFSILVGYSENHGPSRLFAWKGKKKGGKRKKEKTREGESRVFFSQERVDIMRRGTATGYTGMRKKEEKAREGKRKGKRPRERERKEAKNI